jgi:hypothetical protein
MSETIIVGILSLIGTFIGSFSGIHLIKYRIEQLEKKVEKHNQVIERTFKLEGLMTEVEHEINDLKRRAS